MIVVTRDDGWQGELLKRAIMRVILRLKTREEGRTKVSYGVFETQAVTPSKGVDH